jgi:hypothetical protein
MLLSNSKSWLQGTANLTRWYADNAERILADQDFDENGTV